MKSERYLNGYRLIYLPSHNKAMTSENWVGYVYEHIVVAEELIGRSLRDDEEVHHLNGIRDDNNHYNILILMGSQHTKLHNWLRKCATINESCGSNGVNSGKPNPPIRVRHCEYCGSVLSELQSKFCGKKCDNLYRRLHIPSKEELSNLITELTTNEISAKFRVSPKTVRSWYRSYGGKAILIQATGTPVEGAETSGEVEPS